MAKTGAERVRAWRERKEREVRGLREQVAILENQVRTLEDVLYEKENADIPETETASKKELDDEIEPPADWPGWRGEQRRGYVRVVSRRGDGGRVNDYY